MRVCSCILEYYIDQPSDVSTVDLNLLPLHWLELKFYNQ